MHALHTLQWKYSTVIPALITVQTNTGFVFPNIFSGNINALHTLQCKQSFFENMLCNIVNALHTLQCSHIHWSTAWYRWKCVFDCDRVWLSWGHPARLTGCWNTVTNLHTYYTSLSCQHSSKHWTGKQHSSTKTDYFASHLIFRSFSPFNCCLNVIL